MSYNLEDGKSWNSIHEWFSKWPPGSPAFGLNKSRAVVMSPFWLNCPFNFITWLYDLILLPEASWKHIADYCAIEVAIKVYLLTSARWLIILVHIQVFLILEKSLSVPVVSELPCSSRFSLWCFHLFPMGNPWTESPLQFCSSTCRKSQVIWFQSLCL